jgi:hypothetical protein
LRAARCQLKRHAPTRPRRGRLEALDRCHKLLRECLKVPAVFGALLADTFMPGLGGLDCFSQQSVYCVSTTNGYSTGNAIFWFIKTTTTPSYNKIIASLIATRMLIGRATPKLPCKRLRLKVYPDACKVLQEWKVPLRVRPIFSEIAVLRPRRRIALQPSFLGFAVFSPSVSPACALSSQHGAPSLPVEDAPL